MSNDTKRYKKSPAVLELERLFHEAKVSANPNFPYHVKTSFRDDSANSLTKCVMAYLKLKGAWGARVNTTGTYDPKLKRFRFSGATKGVSDITAVIKGRFVSIEIKYKRDTQSEAQKLIQQQIEAAGGVYYIARDFEAFYKWFNEKFN